MESLLTPMWILRTLTDGQPEQIFRILPGGVRTVGRATGADFIVDAALVSRVHCRLTLRKNGELEVRDLKSTNGTFVNGQRVEFARLASGDRLQVGRLELVVTRDPAPAKGEPESEVHTSETLKTSTSDRERVQRRRSAR
jgi:pSer/pThr/pTyr-binding forkhead associated (FHA) protein